MSAWIVSKNHIDYMVTAAIAAELIPGNKADETGRMLWGENVTSVAYRYPTDQDEWLPQSRRDAERYQWQEKRVLTGGALRKTVDCYDYQSCEHPGYEASEAQRLVVELERVAGTTDYDPDTPWGWPEDERLDPVYFNVDGQRVRIL